MLGVEGWYVAVCTVDGNYLEGDNRDAILSLIKHSFFKLVSCKSHSSYNCRGSRDLIGYAKIAFSSLSASDDV